MNGIDISNWQSSINLSAVRPEFVIAKISEGTTFRDGSFDRFYNDCSNLDIPIGAYVYSHSTSAERGRAEAEYALQLLNGRPLDLPIFLDIEADILNAGMSALMASALSFAETVKGRGYKAGVYASAYPFKTVLDADKLRENGIYIWCAAYNGGNAPPMDCDIWQSSNTSRWPGYNGPLDKDSMLIDILGKTEPVYDDKTESGLITEDDDDVPATPRLYKADMSTLCRGFYGTQVILWQRYLVSSGYLAEDCINGTFDWYTEKATKNYQSDHGLSPDGMPGSKTYNA